MAQAEDNYVTVTNSTISGNSSNSGGGIYGWVVTVTNSTISGNTYGGIEINSGYGTFINNIFIDNSSDIAFWADASVYNNYIDYTKLENQSSYVIVKQNNIQPSAGSLNFADSDFRLGVGSVAIDKGLDPNSVTFKGLLTNSLDSNLLAKVLNALQGDKDGNQRMAGVAIDLGAYEFGASPTTTTSTTTTTTTSTTSTTKKTSTTTTSSTTTTTSPAGLVILTSSPLPNGKVGVAYNSNIAVSGGTSPYMRTLSGALPAGLKFNKLSGLISGKPKSLPKKLTSKTFNFKITATDSGKPKQKTSKPFAITITK